MYFKKIQRSLAEKGPPQGVQAFFKQGLGNRETGGAKSRRIWETGGTEGGSFINSVNKRRYRLQNPQRLFIIESAAANGRTCERGFHGLAGTDSRYHQSERMSDSMKLLSVAVPCYNSQDYMEHCVETLLSGGPDMEILIVDDGSTDATAEIADRLEAEHPGVVRALHQENAGHGGAVTTGLRNATGLYFKVVDSDDWVDEAALSTVLEHLRDFSRMEEPVDLVVSNYIYDKVEAGRRRTIRYRRALPEERVLQWDDVRHFRMWENLLMHAMIYRTEVLRGSGLSLPEHTFYVDNLYCTVPLTKVRTLYYVDVDLYHYYIGREGQSVQESTLIRRIDQQIRVNKLMMDQVDLQAVRNRRQRRTILHYHNMITAVTSVHLILGGTPEHLEKKKELWRYIRENHPWEYRRLRHSLFGVTMNLPGPMGRRIDVAVYRIANRVFSFN